MDPDTDSKLATALRQLREEQARGEAPPPGEVSRAELARRAGVSKDTIARIEGIFRARLTASLLAEPDLPLQIRKKISRNIQP